MKKNKTILIVGGCGSGKTWVCKQIINDYKLNIKAKIKSVYFNTNKKISVMGKYDGSIFEGSDKLCMSVMKDADYLRFVQRKNNLTIIAEGDRFMNSTFIQKFKPYIIKIKNDGKKGREKRMSKQTDGQIKRIQTRVNNIKEDISFSKSEQALRHIKIIINEST